MYLKCSALGGLSAILFFASAFPYVFPLAIGSDTQPYAMFVATTVVMLLFPFCFRITRVLALGIVVLAVATVVMILHGMSATSLRSYANYVSFATIGIAVYRLARIGCFQVRTVLRLTVAFWLLFGLLQFVTGLPVGTNFVARSSGFLTGGRGVLSLASEPTHYAFICLLLMITSRILASGSMIGKMEHRVIVVVLLAQIFILAQSALVALIVVLWRGIVFVLTGSFRTVCLKIGVSIVLYVLLLQAVWEAGVSSGSRLLSVTAKLLKQPWLFYQIDASANDRISHVFFSFQGMLRNYGWPHGFGAFSGYVQEQLPHYSDVFFHVSLGDRIMSGYGAAAFELGLVGLLVPVLIHVVVKRSVTENSRSNWGWVLLFHMAMLMALPIATPLVGVVVGLAAYYGSARFSARRV